MRLIRFDLMNELIHDDDDDLLRFMINDVGLFERFMMMINDVGLIEPINDVDDDLLRFMILICLNRFINDVDE